MVEQKIRAIFNTIAFYDSTRTLQSDLKTDSSWDQLINEIDAALCALGFVRQYTKHPEWIEDHSYYMAIGAFRQSHESDVPHLFIYHELRDQLQLVDCSTVSESQQEFVSDLIEHLNQYKLQIQNT